MTAHHFLPRIREQSGLRFLSALEVMAAGLAEHHPEIEKLGILATMGSRRARLYETSLPELDILWPSEQDQQALVMEAIYGKKGIKAGVRGEPAKRLLLQAAGRLIDAGAQAIVAGCTEVPLALWQEDLPVPLLDPMTGLALALVREARS
jgi:aspartate racemase